MASIPKQKQKDRERQIRAFMTRARTSQRPNTTPANLTKKPGIPAPRQFSASSTFKRSQDGPSPYDVPLLGQALGQRNRLRAGLPARPRLGSLEGIPRHKIATSRGRPTTRTPGAVSLRRRKRTYN